MAKRYTDSRKWDDPWFTDLPLKYKMLWIYMLDKCNHAGIFKPNLKLASYLNDVPYTQEEVLEVFKGRLTITPKGDWFFEKYVDFQYGQLDENNRCHNSVIAILQKEGLYKGLNRVLQDRKSKDKDKRKEIIDSKSIKVIIEDLNKVTSSSYKPDALKTVELITARTKEGFTQADFFQVHRTKFAEWGNDKKMSKFLRPETLYGTKFESYLQQKPEKETDGWRMAKVDK